MMVKHAGLHERYEPHAFDNNIGRLIPIKIDQDGQRRIVGTGIIQAITVAPDGLSADIILDAEFD